MTSETKPANFRPLADALPLAQQHAAAGRWGDFGALCEQITSTLPSDPAAQITTGTLYASYGFLSAASACYQRAQALAPTDLRATTNLANLASDAGQHRQARSLYGALLAQLPEHPVIRRNALISLEYDPEVPDAQRLAQAKDWGNWATARVGGAQPRPPLAPLAERPLRVGYVSADFCQHTVGLFVQAVLQAHDPQRVTAYAYSAGPVSDWVTQAIQAATHFRDVSQLDDRALAEQIRADGIDVLIDLSGHTAGSRLTAFAHRPAPVMVSWLAYFATTGLACMDAVLLDDCHAPAGTETQFTEPLIRLPQRLCYTPVPWMPSTTPPAPMLRQGHITFGSFNNTAKLNPGVVALWARILAGVPDARLILKWRTFNDAPFQQTVLNAFAGHGIAPERIELRGPSFHAEVLRQYADIDIALDPFPFTGGLTSCEALYMGVPVITWPQSRVVSRQTYAFLCAIGLPELAAHHADDYVRIAIALAHDKPRLQNLHATLRQRMDASPLCNVAAFTHQLESALTELHRRIERQERDQAMPIKTILHVGPGHRANGAQLPPALQGGEWQEIRLDIDPANEPDIVGSMLDMSAVPSQSVDALYSAHNIEHVHTHEVAQVLQEFLRVLKPNGFLVVTCPDLQTVCQLVAEDQLGDAAYQSPAGPITPLDILYGHGAALAAGHHYMAHKTGFTLKTLTQALHSAGFSTSAGKRRQRGLDLWVLASKGAMAEEALRELAGRVLPG